MRRPVSLLLAPLMLAISIGCSTSTGDDAPTDRFVTLVVTLQDSSGAPVHGGYATARVFPAPIDTAELDLVQRSDANGRFVVPLGLLAESRLDSLSAYGYARGCGYDFAQAVLAAEELPAEVEDTLRLTIVVPIELVPATNAVGRYCGFSVSGPPFYQPDFRLMLRVDSASTTRVVGRFRMNYNWTQGDDYGAFQGTITDNLVVLELPTDSQWGTCTGFRLGGPIHPDGTWGTLELLQPQGCSPDTMRFDMAIMREDVYWP